ncbi:MAG: hypothetical protein IJD17_02750 [Clostridia bacterium]|nr:hypothetical protein [Clostridia bacterium]
MSKKSERLYEILQDMDDDMIAVSAPVNKKAQKTSPLKWLSIAACFILLTGIGVGVWRSGIVDPSSAVLNNDPPKVSDNITDPPETSINTEENTDPADENTTDVTDPEVPEDTGGETPNGIGGGDTNLLPINKFYPLEIEGIDLGYTDTPGCFVYDRSEELNKILDECDAMLKKCDTEFEKSYYGNYMWHVTQGLDLTREDLEIYSKLALEHNKLTDEQIDALLIEDVEEARKALRSPYTLYSEVDNNIYRVVDLEKLTEAEFKALEFSTEDVQRFTAAIAESDDFIASISFVNEICEMAGIDPVVEDTVVE